ncbi:hypothetical protein CRE_08987 [Caenorhabditis remanei]|uniref:F-box domain-containing protein n=1 Tax=Caenorhabditis remanei TaxID=31234 RepID=E3LIM4_CAERE|nr:hypothetical protein CRE_08987 [Caenorhabditis remanei]
MAEEIRKNALCLRTCILYEFLDKKPVFDAYKSLCTQLGESAIDYTEFEFWYMRFSQGTFDLEHERRFDSKSLSLMTLPVKILEKIVGKSELKEHLILRNVCKKFRKIVVNADPRFKIISIKATASKIEFELDNDYQLEYKNINSALSDLIVILSNPKIRLESLEIRDIDQKYMKMFWKKLGTLKLKLHVESVLIEYENTMEEANILKYLKPGILKTIILERRVAHKDIPVNSDEITEGMNRIIETEQYKKVKMLYVRPNCGQVTFPVKAFMKCSQLTINFHTLTSTQLANAVLVSSIHSGASNSKLNFQPFLKSTELQLLRFKTQRDTKMETVKDNLLVIGGKDVRNCPNSIRFPIKKSKNFFELQINGLEIRIERK